MDNEKQKYSVDEILEQNQSGYMEDEPPRELFEDFDFPEEKTEKKKRGWFGRKKKKAPDFDESEELYYGVQARSLDEFRKGYDPTGEIRMEDDTFAKLFDDTIPSLDEEVERNFQRIQKERRRRVAEAVESAGVDMDRVEDELGILAPMPVTSFSADPYAKQHGIAAEDMEEDDQFQKAMMQTAENQTMEIKLNVLNDTVELQKNLAMPVVDEDTVSRILETAANPELEETHRPFKEQEEAPKRQSVKPVSEDARIIGDISGEDNPGVGDNPSVGDNPGAGDTQNIGDTQVIRNLLEAQLNKAVGSDEDDEEYEEAQLVPEEDYDEPKPKVRKPQHMEPVSQNTSMYLEIPSEDIAEFPRAQSSQQYRDKIVPVHIVNIDVLQSAIITESAQYEKKEKGHRGSPFKRFTARIKEDEADAAADESIDDYTSPSDARAIANELTGDMRRLSLRLLVTGLSAVILFITSLVCEGAPSAQPGNPIPYLIINLGLILVCAGFCLRSILDGLKNLMKFNANGDSAAALATAAVLIQAVLGFLFQDSVAGGTTHVYGLVVALTLFLNGLGKLTLLRRIHSNFRFVTAREQKYAVKIYGDYNTGLKLAGDSVAQAPVIAYQKKTGFLKRFLQLSYEPDPSEQSSQNLAPLGLIAALILFLATLFISKDFYLGLTAFAAACCVLVAAGNMLAVNLPLSKLCKRARRAGAMIVGYTAMSQMAKVNAVMVDASDLFPAGTVVLDGVKTFGGGDKEEAILFATALIRQVGGTLSDVFSQVAQENEEDLPKASNLVLEDEHGITGSVGGRKVLVGNRTLLLNHHIEPPEREEVTKYTVGDKKVLFVAMDGILQAMLVLSYRADKRKKNELQRMEENGVSLVVRSTDANITQNMVGKLFGISPSSVNVITGSLAETYEELVNEESPRADALVATKGRVESMINVIVGCIRERRTVSLVTAVQNIAVILGFVLVSFLACFSGIAQLSSMAIAIYMLFWLVVVLMLPKIKKP